MRIAVDIRCLMDGRRTGVEEYTIEMIRALARAFPADEFLLFANSRKEAYLPEFPESNVKVRRFRYPNKLFNIFLKFFGYPKLDELMERPDAFFLPAFRLAPTSGRCPVVLTLHDLSFVRHPEYFSPSRRLWHILMDPRRLSHAADRVIAVSEATARDAADLYGIRADKIRVVPSGLSAAFLEGPSSAERKEEVRKRYGLPPSFILFLGTIEPRKNMRGLVAAYGIARKRGYTQKLVIAGIRGWIGKDFERCLVASEYAADIIVTGFIEDEDKPALYELADVFVYPSFYEGYGFPPLESLARGTPVVTSYNSSLPEVAGELAYLANPYDPAEIGAVICEALAAGKNSLPRLCAPPSWDAAARATMAVIKEAVERKKCG